MLPLSLGRPLLFAPSGVTLLYCVLLVFVLYHMLHIACFTGSSTLVCPFSLLCCIVFCLSSFCFLRSILHVSLGRPLLIVTSGVTVLYCVLSVFVLYLMLHVACDTGLSILDCPFSLLCCILFCLSSFYIVCSMLPVSLCCPFLIAPSVYCVVFCFVCLHSISFSPCCLCLCVVHS